MAKYSGMSAIQATSMQINEIYEAQLRELKRREILQHQKARTWEMPENTYERAMFESWLDSSETWKYGFGMDWLEVYNNMTRADRIKMVEEYKGGDMI